MKLQIQIHYTDEYAYCNLPNGSPVYAKNIDEIVSLIEDIVKLGNDPIYSNVEFVKSFVNINKENNANQ